MKSCLRAYVGATSPFFLEKAPSTEAYFNTTDVARTRTEENSEALNRLGMSFFAANSESGIDALQFLFGTDGEMSQAGISQLSDLFQSPRGQSFFKACSYLNKQQRQARSKQLTTEHMEGSSYAFRGSLRSCSEIVPVRDPYDRKTQFICKLRSLGRYIASWYTWANCGSMAPKENFRPHSSKHLKVDFSVNETKERH